MRLRITMFRYTYNYGVFIRKYEAKLLTWRPHSLHHALISVSRYGHGLLLSDFYHGW